MLVPLAVLAFMLIAGGIWLLRQEPRRLGAPEIITWGGLALLIVIINGVLELVFPTGDIDGWALVALVEGGSLMIAVFGLWVTTVIFSIPGTRSNRPQKLIASILGLIILAALVVLHIAFYRVDAGLAALLMTGLAPLLVPSATLVTLMWWPRVQQRLFSRVQKAAGAVVVLGGGLRSDGRPTRLLAKRIEAGVAALERAKPEAPIIMTGGQGPDEVIAEAESMAQHAIELGTPENRILREDTSTSTFTNLRNARGILVRREIDDPIVVVTSEYHVPRAANTMRSVPLEGQVLPSRTHPAYLPAAVLRETLAILWQRKPMTIGLLVVSLVPAAYAVLATFGSAA
ncbi:YdcF family protein [uncultured Agrococcus sp.]|uniref:YdcF family protein n=1 Tax=uncultured Agrococcus sp. TaxID=382258 RepID=UPI0025D143FB|nr:YdcF family protein [uncultured Agrococcus sp.]